MISSGYQQRVQGSNSPTYLSPQQQQQGSGVSAQTPIRNPQTGNFVQGQGASSQISPGVVQYQPINQGNGGYNGANTGFHTVTITGYSQTGGGSNPTVNQASNPSTFPVSQGGNQQAWNTQTYNAPSSGYSPNQPGNVNVGGQNRGSYFPQQPQRDDQINNMGQSRPYQVTANYGESQPLAGSSSNGRMPTTASQPFTQAPYSPSNVPNQGVFPTAPINVYSGEMSSTSAGTQGYPSGSSGMPYTSTPFSYEGTQNPNQGLSSQGAVNPNQVPYGTSTNTFQGTQPGSTMGTGQFTPAPYQPSGTQSTSGFTSSGQTTQYTNQYDPSRTQTTMYDSTSPTQSPTSNYPTNNPQSQAPSTGFTSSSQQPSYNYQTSGPQGQPQTSPAGFATSSPQSPNNYQLGGPQGPALDSSAGFSSSTQQTPYGYQNTEWSTTTIFQWIFAIYTVNTPVI
ncbi:hypothetical protein TELCIR_17293 [Teladorsagia circumcincta]|uniref:Uncharacterized protein n=1 Tax=Teladorsagia circumcincta TaxID=45464 RepID=A0A2G9TUR4_TELCI|nr:hypothetical protein TELCIR_17293 [Teladorsagia circumcincta]